MSKVASKNTRPEMIVRRALYAAGIRFRIHRRDLPGTPDIVLPKYRTVVFVHGCFWHGHHCRRGRRPSSNVAFWSDKLDRNIERDHRHRDELKELGWTVETVWECDLPNGIRNILDRVQASVPAIEAER